MQTAGGRSGVIEPLIARSVAPAAAMFPPFEPPFVLTAVLRSVRGRPSHVGPETQKSPAEQGFSRCAEEDSNLHGGNPPQGPQPCASNNSATGARAAPSIAPGRG